MSAPAGPWAALAALVATELRLATRRGENLLVTGLVPAAVLAVLAGTAILPVPGRAVDTLLPGAIGLGVVAAGLVALGISTAYERSYGVLKRLGGAPIPRWIVLAAKLASTVIVVALQVAVLVAVAAAGFGWAPGHTAQPLVGLAGLALGIAAFGGFGLALAGALRAEATLAVANGLFVGLLLVGGIVLPVDHLSEPLRTIAAILPSAPLVEVLGIALASGPAAGGDPVGPLAILAAWATVAALSAGRTFRWE